MTCDPCTCWWQYGEHQRNCVPQWQIDLAKVAVQFRATIVTEETLPALEWSVHCYRELLNQRWRDMVRDPPNFAPALQETEKLKSLNLADLGL